MSFDSDFEYGEGQDQIKLTWTAHFRKLAANWKKDNFSRQNNAAEMIFLIWRLTKLKNFKCGDLSIDR